MKILIVSQDYRNFDQKFGDIYKDAKALREIYARFKDRLGKKFQGEFVYEDFFEKSGKDFGDLQAQIITGAYDIVHFSLHSNNNDVVLSEDEFVPYQEFQALFEKKHKTRVVILNICNSSGIAEHMAANVEYVLGWEDEPGVDRTKKISEIFYLSLFGGNSISDSFSLLEQKKDIKSIIFKPDKPGQTENPKKRTAFLLPGILSGILVIIITVIVILILRSRDQPEPAIEPGKNYTVDTEKTDSPEERQVIAPDNLFITSPAANSRVSSYDTVQFTATPPSGYIPWAFVSPPDSEVWFPQFKPRNIKTNHWLVTCTIGKNMDSGLFTIIIMLIPVELAEQMQTWLNSQGTEMQSDPINSEWLQEYPYLAADTLTVERIPE